MSRSAGALIHPINGQPVPVFSGFSWPCLFFGCFWYLYKGMVAWFLISLIAVIVTGGLALPLVWIILAFLANGAYTRHLLSQGYLTPQQNEGRRYEAQDRRYEVEERRYQDEVRNWQERRASRAATADTPAPPASLADELAKLAKLRDDGILSEAEFEAQKKRLLQ